MPWKRRLLRGNEVFARARPDGTLELDADNRVEVKYRLDAAAKVYRASARNLETPSGANGEDALLADPPGAASDPHADPQAAGRRESIVVYTDGGAMPNPGPMGIGVVILRQGARQEIGEFLGEGTNNIAELSAIEHALDALSDADRAHNVLVHADSAYAIGVVSGAYKAKKNLELVARLREKATRFPHLRFIKVAGHAGVAENERCDQLASEAIALGTRGGRRR